MKDDNSNDNNNPTSFFIYGGWPVREALAAGRVRELLLVHNAHGEHVAPIIQMAKKNHVTIRRVLRDDLDKMTHGLHQGVVARTNGPRYMEMDDLWQLVNETPTAGPSLLFLDGITDPQNLGSILRTACYFDVPGVVIPKWRAASLNATVVKASAGGALHMAIAEVSNLASALDAARKKGFWIAGADMAGQDVNKVDFPKPYALVLGSEGEGMHDIVRKKCDLLVSVPKFGKKGVVDSLNVGVAFGVLLHAMTKGLPAV